MHTKQHKAYMDNIDIAIEEFDTSIKPWHNVDYDTYNSVKEVLDEIKSDTLINMFIDTSRFDKIEPRLSSDLYLLVEEHDHHIHDILLVPKDKEQYLIFL